jgi:PAS domain S-box-containing protein
MILPTRKRDIFIISAAAIIFSFLFLKAQEINYGQHDNFSSELRRIKELDARLNQNILKSRHGLLNYYDPLANDLNELNELKTDLKNIPDFIDSQGRIEIQQYLQAQTDVFEQKERLIEQFKSKNAILKNSLYYLPNLTTELAEKANSQIEDRKLGIQLEELLRNILVYNLTNSEELAPKIQGQMGVLLTIRNQYSSSVNGVDLDRVILHGKTILKNKPQVDSIVQELLALKTWRRTEDLYKSYNHSYERAIKIANIYRLFLSLFSMMLIGSIATSIIFKLRKSAQIVSTAKEKLQEALEATQQAEEKYRSIFENSTDGIFQTTSDGRYLSVNPTLANIYGYASPAEVIENLTAISQQLYVDPKRRDEFVAAIAAEDAVSQFESQVYCKDGSIIWISESARAVNDQHGKLLYYEGTVQDITARKQAEASLEKSVALLRATFESTADGILAVDTQGNIVSYNRKFLDMWKISDELLSLPNLQERIAILAQELNDPEAFLHQVKQVYAQPNLEINDFVELKDKRILERYSLPQRIGETIVGRVWNFRDITARKRAEEALRQEQEKAELLLLNVLPQAIAERLKQNSGSIADSFAEVSVLFADLVGFTQLSAAIQPVELVELLNEIFSAFDQLADRHGLEKIKTIGDAYMVVGGLPTPRSDHAEAIAAMALDILQEISRFQTKNGEKFSIRIGINTGPVVAGVIGIKKFIYDLWGDTVNIASRMESQGLPGCIQVTTSTYKLLAGKFVFEERGTIQVKGKGEMTTYLLLDKHPG